MALGRENRQGRFDDVMLLVGDQLVPGSNYRLLAEHGDALFGEEYFADLFKRSALGHPTVPARMVATVMLLQAYEGLSSRIGKRVTGWHLTCVGKPPRGTVIAAARH